MNHVRTIYINITIFLGIAFFVFCFGVLALHFSGPLTVAAETVAEDVVPPFISNISVKDITSSSTVITWNTDELADSLVNFSLNDNYGIVRNPRFDKTTHEIFLDELLPNTNYYLRITSSDASGNQGISSDLNFRTKLDKQASLTGGELKANALEALNDIIEMVNLMSSGEELEKLNANLDDQGGGSEKEIDGALGDILNKLKLIASEQNLDLEEIRRDKEEGTLEGGDGNLEYVSLKEVLELLDAIKSEEGLETVQEEVRQKAEEELKPPTIILDYADLIIGTDYVTVIWKTDKESNSVVSLVEDKDYSADKEDPYLWNEGEPEEMVLDHNVTITGLKPATTYHFQVSSKSALDLTGKSVDKTFRTKSILPEIYNLQVVKIEENAATIRWSTNVPCSSIIEYTNLSNSDTKLEGNSSFIVAHTIRLTNLIFDTYYSAQITVESEEGEKAKSETLTFITTRDRFAPEISKVNTESTLYPGSDNKIQTIISWQTDEKSRCQLFYHQGLVLIDEPETMSKEDDYAAKHVQVLTNFIPASVYKFWIVCEDEAENSGKSEDYTMLTPSQEENIIDIIIKNFENSFGWLKRK